MVDGDRQGVQQKIGSVGASAPEPPMERNHSHLPSSTHPQHHSHTHLRRHEEGVVGQLHNLHARRRLVLAHKAQPSRLKLVHQLRVDLVPGGVDGWVMVGGGDEAGPGGGAGARRRGAAAEVEAATGRQQRQLAAGDLPATTKLCTAPSLPFQQLPTPALPAPPPHHPHAPVPVPLINVLLRLVQLGGDAVHRLKHRAARAQPHRAAKVGGGACAEQHKGRRGVGLPGACNIPLPSACYPSCPPAGPQGCQWTDGSRGQGITLDITHPRA